MMCRIVRRSRVTRARPTRRDGDCGTAGLPERHPEAVDDHRRGGARDPRSRGGLHGADSPRTYAATTQFFVSTSGDDTTSALQQGNTFTQARVKTYAQLLETAKVLNPVISKSGLKTTADKLCRSDHLHDPARHQPHRRHRHGQLPRTRRCASPSHRRRLPADHRQRDERKGARRAPSGDRRRGRCGRLEPGEPEAGAQPRPRPRARPAPRLRRRPAARRARQVGQVPARPRGGHRPHRSSAASPSTPTRRRTRSSCRSTRTRSAPRRSARCAPTCSSSTSPTRRSRSSSRPRCRARASRRPPPTSPSASPRPAARSCVIDGDLRRPRLLDYLGFEGVVGLTDVLVGRADVEDVLQPFGRTGPAPARRRPHPAQPERAARLGRWQQLLADLAERFDYVLIDAPPLLPVTDAAVLSTIVDGALVVVGAGVAQREHVRRALDSLEPSTARCSASSSTGSR